MTVTSWTARHSRFLAVAVLAFVASTATACGAAGQTAEPAPDQAATVSDSAPAATSPVPTERPEQIDQVDSEITGPRPLADASGIPTVVDPGPAPIGLRIPDLDIDNSVVKPVGVEPNGDFEVPIASEVGWYRFGSRPGQEGSNVLAAHIAYDGEDGVFRYLSTLDPGSIVEVELEDGSVVSYEATERTTYKKEALPFDEIFDDGGPDRLVLVTCGGDFDPSASSYDSNVVVYAERLT